MSKRRNGGKEIFEIMGTLAAKPNDPTPADGTPSVPSEIQAETVTLQPAPEPEAVVETPVETAPPVVQAPVQAPPVAPPPPNPYQVAANTASPERGMSNMANNIIFAALLVAACLLGAFALGTWFAGDRTPVAEQPTQDNQFTNPNQATAEPQNTAPRQVNPAPAPRQQAPKPVVTAKKYTVMVSYWNPEDRSTVEQWQTILKNHFGLSSELVPFTKGGKRFVGLTHGAFAEKSSDDAQAALESIRGIKFRGRQHFEKSAYIFKRP